MPIHLQTLASRSQSEDRQILRRSTAAALTAVITASTGAAMAQTPAGLNDVAPATSGKTDVAEEGFQRLPEPDEDVNATEFHIAAGALLTSGNSRAISATTATKFRLRREQNQLGAAASFNFARSAPDQDSGLETTVENYQGNVRYTRFFSDALGAFINVAARRDRFQGLDLRLNLAPGIAYYFMDRDKLRLWAELGYDLQYDIRRLESIEEAEAAAEENGETLNIDRTETRHNGRAFLGYENDINASVAVFSGLEYIQSVTETRFWRLDFDFGLSSKVGEKFSVATTFGIAYDNSPLPGVEETDVVSAVNLVYTLL